MDYIFVLLIFIGFIFFIVYAGKSQGKKDDLLGKKSKAAQIKTNEKPKGNVNIKKLKTKNATVENSRSKEVEKKITEEWKTSLIDLWLLPPSGPEFVPRKFEDIQISVTMPIEVPLEEVHQWHIDELGRDHLQIHEIKHRGYNIWVQQGSQSSSPRKGVHEFFHCVELSSSLARCERFELIVPQSLWGKDGPLVDKVYTYRMNALIDGEKDDLLNKKVAKSNNNDIPLKQTAAKKATTGKLAFVGDLDGRPMIISRKSAIIRYMKLVEEESGEPLMDPSPKFWAVQFSANTIKLNPHEAYSKYQAGNVSVKEISSGTEAIDDPDWDEPCWCVVFK